MTSRTLLAFLACGLIATSASAQSADAPSAQGQPAASQGPMRIERVRSGFLGAPDFKVTDIDGATAEMVGGYAGWINDSTFFVGGGAYFLANPTRDREMGYGGLVLQWLSRTNRPVGYSVKGLVGLGEATLPLAISPVEFFDARGRFDGRLDQRLALTTRVRTHQAFFIAEPEADLLVRLTSNMRLTVGAGYRAIAAERGAGERLRGATGTIGLQIGGGS